MSQYSSFPDINRYLPEHMQRPLQEAPAKTLTCPHTPFSVASVYRLLENWQNKKKAPVIDFDIRYCPEIDSTMNIVNYCREHDGSAPQAGLVLVAGKQTKGIGFSGPWVSEEADIKMTLVLNESEDRTAHSLIDLAAPLSIVKSVKAISDEPDLPVFIKWPNDVYAIPPDQDEARKLSGILTVDRNEEESIAMMQRNGFEMPEGLMLIGVGINLRKEITQKTIHLKNQQEVHLKNEATSLESLTEELYSREAVIASFLADFSYCLELIRSSQQEIIYKQAFENLLLGRDGTATLETFANKPQKAKILGINKNGLVRVFFQDEEHEIKLEDIRRISLD